MSLDWHVGWWSTSTVQSLNQQVVFSLINLQELEDKGDSLRIERVIGQYALINPQAVMTGQGNPPLMLYTRLVIRPSTAVDGPYIPDIGLLEMADEKFMWHKVHFIPRESTNMEPYAHTEWSHLDVKVNRSMNDMEELLFLIEPQLGFLGGEDTGSFYAAAWLRVLVSS